MGSSRAHHPRGTRPKRGTVLEQRGQGLPAAEPAQALMPRRLGRQTLRTRLVMAALDAITSASGAGAAPHAGVAEAANAWASALPSSAHVPHAAAPGSRRPRCHTPSRPLSGSSHRSTKCPVHAHRLPGGEVFKDLRRQTGSRAAASRSHAARSSPQAARRNRSRHRCACVIPGADLRNRARNPCRP